MTQVKKTRGMLGYSSAIRLVLLFGFLTLTTGAAYHSAALEESPLVRVVTTSDSYVGELQNEDEKTVQLLDFESNRSVSLSKTSVTRIENPITLDDAARYIGLPAVMGRKISVLSQREIPKGKIAKVSPQVVYLTLGESSGVIVGQKVSVFRGEGDILDPDTGAVLASERARIAELQISEVSGKISKAKLIGDLEIKLEVGDEVEPQGSEVVVAVCPLSNDDGSANSTGNSIAEQLISALVQRDVSVVERSALDTVLGELIAQNTILFEQKSAQQLGKLTGASVVLTGKIIQEKSAGTAHLRLIDVKTGEILLAISAPVKLTAGSSTSMSTSGSRPRIPEPSSKKEDIPLPSGEFEYLGKSRSLPNYLTTTAALERRKDGGVRFQGPKMHEDFDTGIIVTRERNFLDRNFVFEVLVTFGPNDGIAHVGMGAGRQDGSANRRADSVFIKVCAPHHCDGEVQLEGGKTGLIRLGKIPQGGVHLVRLTKEGDTLTFEVDPENDGPTDDDMETVIPDLREHSPALNSKNSTLFLAGTGEIVATRLKLLP